MSTIEFNQEVASLRDTLEMFTRRFTRSREESEDLIQDTVLKALTYRDKFRTNSNLKGWLYTIMRNTFINNYRKTKHATVLHDTTPESYYLNVADDHTFNLPDSSVEYADIQKAIENIKADLRIPFTMHMEGFKYQEISEQLDIPMGTVKNRIFHARQEIQKNLTAYS